MATEIGRRGWLEKDMGGGWTVFGGDDDTNQEPNVHILTEAEYDELVAAKDRWRRSAVKNRNGRLAALEKHRYMRQALVDACISNVAQGKEIARLHKDRVPPEERERQVEAVAKAVHARASASIHALPWGQIGPQNQDGWRKIARQLLYPEPTNTDTKSEEE